MGATFLDLPDELILHIAKLTDRNDRCKMRLVARRIDYCISPMMFETLRSLRTSPYEPAPYASLTEYLSCGKELVFSRCTKKIFIRAGGSDPSNWVLPWLRLLKNFVPTLTNLQSLMWSYWPHEHPVSDLVMDTFNSFGSLPYFKELAIRIIFADPFPGFNLKAFSNLVSLSIDWQHTANVPQFFVTEVAGLLGRCPELESFTFRIPRPYHPSDAPSLAYFLADLPSTTRLKLRLLDVTGLCVSADDFRIHLHHLLPLKVLQLMLNRHANPPQQNGDICQLLLENSIYLDELTIDTTHPTSVLNYLSSYCGLQRLGFRSRYPEADTPDGIHHFFASVLPRHSATLQKLYLGWSVESLWTKEIALHDLGYIQKCQRLTTLMCYVTVTDGPTTRTDKVLRRWLETAAKLPYLLHLMFRTTCLHQPPLRGGEFHYDLATMHEGNMQVAIIEFAEAAVEKLRAGLAVPFRVTVSSPSEGP